MKLELLSTLRETWLTGLFKIAPAMARDAVFVRLSGPKGQTLFLLGTIHSRHLDSSQYSLLHIQAAIHNILPDLVLVESRAEELARGNLGDGPVEMVFATLTAAQLHVTVRGIDWWAPSMGRPGTAPQVREARMVANIVKEMQGAKIALALVGYSHIYEFLHRLRGYGYFKQTFPRHRKRALLEPASVNLVLPEGMRSALEQGIYALEQCAANEANLLWKSALLRTAEVRRSMLDAVNRTGEKGSASRVRAGRGHHG